LGTGYIGFKGKVPAEAISHVPTGVDLADTTMVSGIPPVFWIAAKEPPINLSPTERTKKTPKK
jgi:hypothetical protein